MFPTMSSEAVKNQRPFFHLANKKVQEIKDEKGWRNDFQNLDQRDQDFVFNFRIKGESCKLGIKRSGKDQKTTKELKNDFWQGLKCNDTQQNWDVLNNFENKQIEWKN